MLPACQVAELWLSQGCHAEALPLFQVRTASSSALLLAKSHALQLDKQVDRLLEHLDHLLGEATRRLSVTQIAALSMPVLTAAVPVRVQAVRNSSSDQDGPQLWAQLCECLQAVGDTNGAIALYRDVIGGEHTAPLHTQLPTARHCQLQDAATCRARGHPQQCSKHFVRVRIFLHNSRQGARSVRNGLKLAC